MAVGLLLTLTGIGGPRLPYGAQMIEAGLFLTVAAGAGLAIAVLAGRAPTLRDEEW
jgi:hypothetical protein